MLAWMNRKLLYALLKKNRRESVATFHDLVMCALHFVAYVLQANELSPGFRAFYEVRPSVLGNAFVGFSCLNAFNVEIQGPCRQGTEVLVQAVAVSGQLKKAVTDISLGMRSADVVHVSVGMWSADVVHMPVGMRSVVHVSVGLWCAGVCTCRTAHA